MVILHDIFLQRPLDRDPTHKVFLFLYALANAENITRAYIVLMAAHHNTAALKGVRIEPVRIDQRMDLFTNLEKIAFAEFFVFGDGAAQIMAAFAI